MKWTIFFLVVMNGVEVNTNPLLSTALPEYSTWKTLPSGEKVVTDRSYPVPMELIVV